jgi:protein-S-isoprenylcysteine O-methyltransferase Ste14
MGLRQTIDIPPVWLLGFLGLSYGVAQLWPVRVPGLSMLGLVLAALGLGLLLGAAAQMLARRTTVHPHGAPAVLVTGGLFRLSRNPIYLGDALILAGLTLWWDGAVALVLVPVFVGLITRRFIRPEEARLRAGFGPAAEAFMARTRRWI